MPVQELNTEIYIPKTPFAAAALPSYGNSSTFSASGYRLAAVLSVNKTCSITKVWFRTGTTSGTDNVYTVSIQTVSLTTGAPSGTLWAANTQKTGINGISGSGVSFSATLDAAANVIPGDLIAVVLQMTSYSANATFALYTDGTAGSTFPSALFFNNSAWSLVNSLPTFGLELSDGTFYNTSANIAPISAINSVNITSSSNPRLVGNIIRPSITMRVTGFSLWADLDADVTVILYDSDGTTVLASTTIDAELPAAITVAAIYNYHFTNSAVLYKGRSYYIMVRNSTGTNVATYDFQGYSTNGVTGIDGGTIMRRVTTTVSTPTGVASYTEEDNKISWVGLIVDAVESEPTQVVSLFGA